MCQNWDPTLLQSQLIWKGVCQNTCFLTICLEKIPVGPISIHFIVGKLWISPFTQYFYDPMKRQNFNEIQEW